MDCKKTKTLFGYHASEQLHLLVNSRVLMTPRNPMPSYLSTIHYRGCITWYGSLKFLSFALKMTAGWWPSGKSWMLPPERPGLESRPALFQTPIGTHPLCNYGRKLASCEWTSSCPGQLTSTPGFAIPLCNASEPYLLQRVQLNKKSSNAVASTARSNFLVLVTKLKTQQRAWFMLFARSREIDDDILYFGISHGSSLAKGLNWFRTQDDDSLWSRGCWTHGPLNDDGSTC